VENIGSLSSFHCRPSILQPKAGTQDDNGILLAHFGDITKMGSKYICVYVFAIFN